MMTKLQWCEICSQLVEDVEPARLRGRHLIMACQACLKLFEKKIKAQWGTEQWKYFWDLGPSPVPLAGGGYRRPFTLTLTKEQVVFMQAAGYILVKLEDEDEDHICS